MPRVVPTRLRTRLCLPTMMLFVSSLVAATPPPAVTDFHKNIEPLLQKHCYDCHGDGEHKGKVAFDELSDADLLAKRDLWLAALKNVRAGLMPPKEDFDENGRPTPAEVQQLADWIKYEAFALNRANPDPGRSVARRLNRVEYRNTIRDLMGYEFNSEVEFPPDDTGNGFDNIGDVLTVSPLLLEKYLAAAESIVDHAVPKVARVMRERTATGRDFRNADGRGGGEQLSAKKPAKVSHTFKIDVAETYRLVLELEVRGSFDFDPGHCAVICRVDDEEKFREDVVWHERRTLKHEYEQKWDAGPHVVTFEVEPLEPIPTPKVEAPRFGPPATTSLNVRIASAVVQGPLDPKLWIAPENYARFFPQGPAPADRAARDRYAAELLQKFAARAYRRPVDEALVKKLVSIARDTYTQPGHAFEEGIGHAIMAVLASPRFLFRVDQPVAKEARAAIANVDDWTLASRLSYFLWSTMPDEELFRLAARGELRPNLHAQVERMLKDAKAQAFVRNFTGQWLQARDVETVPINARIVLGLGFGRGANIANAADFDGATRRFMRSETEMGFDYVLREDRSVLELLDCDYAFLNEKLATIYGIKDVAGEQLRKVDLPPDSVRGGVLTQGTVLTVTSNPTRTSPVKRGLFVLENILGTPPPPPPPTVPALEDAKKQFQGREPKLSEMLAVHRADKLCSSCHARMDPLGLAFENFNALGGWRDTDAKQPIDPAGQLITGEKFASVRELKHILTHERHLDYYRCLTEKLLTYALGRGLEYYDVPTVDHIVDQLEGEGGRMSVLLFGAIDSAPFQKMRNLPANATARVTVAPSGSSFSPLATNQGSP